MRPANTSSFPSLSPCPLERWWSRFWWQPGRYRVGWRAAVAVTTTLAVVKPSAGAASIVLFWMLVTSRLSVANLALVDGVRQLGIHEESPTQVEKAENCDQQYGHGERHFNSCLSTLDTAEPDGSQPIHFDTFMPRKSRGGNHEHP